MKLQLGVFCLLLSSTFGWAAPADDIDKIISEGGFYKAHQLPVKPRNLMRASSSVVRLAIPGRGSCAGIMLSPNGYMATAAHCLTDECTEPYGVNPPPIALEKVDKTVDDEMWFTGVRYLNQTPNLSCNGAHGRGGRLYVREYDLGDPKVIWIGKGRHSHNHDRIAELTEDEFNSIVDLTHDVAIVKWERKDVKKRLPKCIPVARVAPRPGDMVWNMGFPDNAKRANGRNADSSFRGMTIGRVRAALEEDSAMQEYNSKPWDDITKALFWFRQKAVYEQPEILLTSADNASGMSGGATLNEDGDLLAVHYKATMSSTEEYLNASSIGFRADALRKLVERDLGSSMAKEIFDCVPPVVASVSGD